MCALNCPDDSSLYEAVANYYKSYSKADYSIYYEGITWKFRDDLGRVEPEVLKSSFKICANNTQYSYLFIPYLSQGDIRWSLWKGQQY